MISPKLRRVILDTLKLEDYPIQDESKAWQIPGWDSLTHVSVIVAVENAFGIRLSGLEVLRLKTVGDLQALVDRKVGQSGSH